MARAQFMIRLRRFRPNSNLGIAEIGRPYYIEPLCSQGWRGFRIRTKTDESKRFKNQDLERGVFKDCRLAGARFDDVDLSESVFSNANFRGARFTNVNLAGVEIDDANIEGLKILGHDIQALARAELSRKQAD